MLMCTTKTEKQIKTMSDRIRAKKLLYFIKNCSSYKVSHTSENEHWLCGNIIVTKWNHDTGCRDDFETWSFHNDIIAGEAFETHQEIEEEV